MLDLGCGNGAKIARLRRTVELVAADLSEEQLRRDRTYEWLGVEMFFSGFDAARTAGSFATPASSWSSTSSSGCGAEGEVAFLWVLRGTCEALRRHPVFYGMEFFDTLGARRRSRSGRSTSCRTSA